MNLPHKDVPLTAETTLDNYPPVVLGPAVMNLPEGPAFCVDAVSATIGHAQLEDTGEMLVVMICAGDFEGNHLGTTGPMHLGTLHPMRAGEARTFAAALLSSAEQVDGGVRG